MGAPVTHFQILAREPGVLAGFYAALFDWSIDDDNPLGYRMLETGNERGIQGGVWPCPAAGRPLVQLYVEVPDLQATLERARSLGGSVVMPPQTLPGGDRMAILVDPEGLPLGLATRPPRPTEPVTSNPPAGYPRVTPYLNYEDTGAMMEWLARAFGLVERQSMRRPDGFVTHAEMSLLDALVMMGSPGGSFRNPKHLGQVTQSLYVYVDDVDVHCRRAREAGAEITEEPADQPYGDRRYGATDPEGHRWYFATRTRAPDAPA